MATEAWIESAARPDRRPTKGDGFVDPHKHIGTPCAGEGKRPGEGG